MGSAAGSVPDPSSGPGGHGGNMSDGAAPPTAKPAAKRRRKGATTLCDDSATVAVSAAEEEEEEEEDMEESDGEGEGGSSPGEGSPFGRLPGQMSMTTMMAIHMSLQTSRPLYNLYCGAVETASVPALAAAWWNFPKPEDNGGRALEERLRALTEPKRQTGLTGRPESLYYACTMSEGLEKWEDDTDEGAPDWEIRHPGDDPSDEPPDAGVDNPRFQPITTKAAQGLYSVHFSPPGSKAADGGALNAAYPWQLMIRVDPHRGNLYYDVAEWCPELASTFFPVTTGRVQAALKRFGSAFPGGSPRRMYDDESDSEEDNDEEGDEEGDGAEATSTRQMRVPEDKKLDTYMKVQVADFLGSRLLRCRLPLKSVTGLALFATSPYPSGSSDAGVLILEVAEPASEFAARRVHSEFSAEETWEPCGDWTPGRSASRATRHYVSGAIKELRELCNYLMAVCPGLKDLVRGSSGRSNSLGPGASLLPEASPEPCGGGAGGATNSNRAPEDHGTGCSAANEDKRPGVLTAEEVVQKLRLAGVEGVELKSDKGDDKRPRVSGVRNRCLLAGIQNGHVKLCTEGGLKQVLHEGSCHGCSARVVCTLEDALDQPCYGGDDYEDGSQEGAVICESCEEGNYITDLCCGKPSFDSGKFHNHCTDCPGFGTCIGDYR